MGAGVGADIDSEFNQKDRDNRYDASSQLKDWNFYSYRFFFFYVAPH